MFRNVVCEYCGDEFDTPSLRSRICYKCLQKKSNKEKAEKERREKKAEKIHDEVREALKLGLSYGQYMAAAKNKEV